MGVNGSAPGGNGASPSGNGASPSSQQVFPSKGVCVRQVPVSVHFIDRTYGELLAHLVRRERLLCLGLYRHGAEGAAEFPYVSSSLRVYAPRYFLVWMEKLCLGWFWNCKWADFPSVSGFFFSKHETRRKRRSPTRVHRESGCVSD